MKHDTSYVEPFEFEVRKECFELVLKGDLEDNADVDEKLRLAIAEIHDCGGEWKVNASEMRLVPTGVDLWARMASEGLRNCKLRYAASQLALILKYHAEYGHPNSSFDERKL